MLTNIFNNRELAIFTWVIIFIASCLYKQSVRESLLQLIAAFFQWKIVSSVILMIMYISLISFIFYLVGFWELSNLKGTVYWSFGGAFILLINSNKATEEDDYFKKTLIHALELTIVIEYIINLYVFGYIAELIIFPVLMFLALLQTVAESKVENKRVNNILVGMLALYVIGIFIFSIVKVFDNVNSFSTLNNLREFLLPLAYTVLFLPFLYFFALITSYETLFTRLGFFINDKELLKYAKWRTVISCHANLKRLEKWANEFGSLNLNNKEEIDSALMKTKNI